MNSDLLKKRIGAFSSAGLYPVVTAEFCAGRSVAEIVQGIASGGADIVQIREKKCSLNDLYELVCACKKITDRYNMLLIVDDHTDIALAAGADGVHLGQDDLPVAAARRMAPDLLIGCSTHNPEEIAKAQADGCGYLNIGPVYPTQTKSVACGALGLENVLKYRMDVQCPYSVMGGIKEHHLPELIRLDFKRIAMVTEITAAPNVAEKVRSLLKYFRQP